MAEPWELDPVAQAAPWETDAVVGEAVSQPKDKLPQAQPLTLQQVQMNVARGATLGATDHLQAGIASVLPIGDAKFGDYKGNLEQVRAQNKANDAARPVMSGVEKGIGAIAGLGKLGAAGKLPSAAVKGKGLLASSAGLAADGAAISGAEALINGRNVLGATKDGAVIGAGLNAATRGTAKAFTPLLTKVKESTTTQQLKGLGNAAFKRLENLGVSYTESAAQTLKQGVIDDLNVPSVALDKVIHPVTWRITKALEKTNGEIPFEKLNQIRKRAQRVASNPTGGEDAYAASILVKNLDEFINSAPPVLGRGVDGNTVTEALKDANGLWRRFKGAESVEFATNKANLRANSTGSGSNIENATRQNIRQILDNPKRSKFFTDEEKKAMEKVVRGGRGQNLLRLLGKAAPTGIVSLSGSALTGSAVGGAPGALALMAAGYGAKNASERLTQRHVDDLLRLIRTGESAAVRTPNAAGRIALNAGNQTTAARAATVGAVSLGNQ